MLKRIHQFEIPNALPEYEYFKVRVKEKKDFAHVFLLMELITRSSDLTTTSISALSIL